MGWKQERGESCEVLCIYLMLQDSYNVSTSVLINSIPAWRCTAFGSLAFLELQEGTDGQGRQLGVCLKGTPEFCLIAPPGIALCCNAGLSAGFSPESSLLCRERILLGAEVPPPVPFPPLLLSRRL